MIRIKRFVKYVLDSPFYCYRYFLVFLFVKERKIQISTFNVKPISGLKPLIIQGMFRSGTSLTSSIINEIGVDFGSEEHLIQAVGKSKELNPRGFYEHYLFAAISRYFHLKTKSSGDNPPSENLTKTVKWEHIDWKELLYYSVVKINDKRVPIQNKLEMWDLLFRLGFEKFILTQFKTPFAIKMPMLTLFTNQMVELFPDSQVIVVVRNPFSVVKSAKKLTKYSSFDLYLAYHKPLSKLDKELTNNNLLYFSYDHLIKNPKLAIKKLYNFISQDHEINDTTEKAINKIDMNLFRNRPKLNLEGLPIEVKNVYLSILDRV